MRGRDWFLAGFGLAALFLQLPITKMILDDPQTLHLGVWNLPTFAWFSLLTFLIIPASVGLVLAAWWSVAPRISMVVLAMGISFVIIAQANFTYLQLYFFHAPWRYPLCAAVWVLSLIPLLRFREQVGRMLKIAALYGPAIFIGFAAQAAPVHVAIGPPSAPPALTAGAPTVLFLSFEKLVASYLADEEGRILADRFPNLDRFVREADYYPRTYANQTATAYALKTLYSGRHWTREREWMNYPTLVSILGAGRRTYMVEEMLPMYCRPPAVCIQTVGRAHLTSQALLRGWYLTYLGFLMPDPIEARLKRAFNLPSFSFDAIRRFWELETDSHAAVGRRQLERLHEAIAHNGDEPALYVMHNFISYDSPVTTSVLHGGVPPSAADRLNELEAVREALRPFDTALGALLDQLKAVGAYDRSLIVIVSDSGYDPGVREVGALLRRGVTIDTLPFHPDLMRIFLAIKRPGQREGRVFAAPVQQLDVLPTVLQDLGIDPRSFHFEGRAVTNPEQTWDLADRPVKFAIASAHSGILRYLLTDPRGPLRRVTRFPRLR